MTAGRRPLAGPQARWRKKLAGDFAGIAPLFLDRLLNNGFILKITFYLDYLFFYFSWLCLQGRRIMIILTVRNFFPRISSGFSPEKNPKAPGR
jgi:hypothetical protein